MYDAASLSDAGTLQRARGVLSVRFGLRDGVTALADLRQEGCLKARFPRRADPDWAEMATLNTSGGIAGGDRLSIDVAVGAGARACIAGQAAERSYRARPGDLPALLRTRIAVGSGARAEWLPQETILFDGAALDRALEVEMAGDAGFLGVEALVFGRAAMGESVRRLWLRDAIRVKRDGVSRAARHRAPHRRRAELCYAAGRCRRNACGRDGALRRARCGITPRCGALGACGCRGGGQRVERHARRAHRGRGLGGPACACRGGARRAARPPAAAGMEVLMAQAAIAP